MFYSVLVASQRYHGKESLTYISDKPLSIGQLVAVPMQRRTIMGIVEAKTSKPAFATKNVEMSWDFFVPPKSLELLKWLTIYYPSPLGLITDLFTPHLPKKVPEIPQIPISKAALNVPPLSPEQRAAIKIIESCGQKSALLHGDTGTGKTRVYLELTQKTLALGKSVIVLTPEIGLTEPLVQIFQQQFGAQVIATHSGMTPAQRRKAWLTCSTDERGLVVIGPRSALFSPLKQIGLIIMDEAHDAAYKQEQAPYYQSSRVAAQLAHLHGAQLVLGSATPSIADYFIFTQKKLPIIRMVEPATGLKQRSDIKIVDQRGRDQFVRSPWLANTLIDAIDGALKKGEQSLLFLNRRGSARLVHCEQCGWQALCLHCDVALTYHADQHAMRCHSCDYSGHVPTSCPDCGKNGLIFKSIGTKALEVEINRLFPAARASRFDGDTHKSVGLSSQHAALQSGEIDILIGTQSIAKGFDLPLLSVVGIVQADSGLQMPDYTASERTFQLISQVSGRISRGHLQGKLFVQTYEPESQLIKLALQKNYSGFYEHEIKQRQLYDFPPAVYLLKITCTRSSRKSALHACNKFTDTINGLGLPVRVEGPSPRFIEKIAGKYAWHIVVKSKDRSHLLQIIGNLPGNCIYDLDPSDLL
ncbi:MAG: primosomal protein N' [Patescibacteria group bacterium]